MDSHCSGSSENDLQSFKTALLWLVTNVKKYVFSIVLVFNPWDPIVLCCRDFLK